VKRSMPVIVIVLMFLVAFLLAVVAMILVPILGIGYELWNKSQNGFEGNRVAAFQCADLERNPGRSNDLHRR